MTPEIEIIPLVTGPLGAIAIGWFWNRQMVKDHAKDRDTWEKQLAEKSATIERLHLENKTLAMEYATNASRIISTLQELKPCQYKPQPNS